jgi:hypothetical protein
MKASEFGINGGWGGLRTTSLLTNLTQNTTDTVDNL